jgi:hypothetical protein
MAGFNYIWSGLNAQPQPSASPSLGLDWSDSILYVSSRPSPSEPSVWIPIGGGPNGGPIIQASLQAINTTVPQSLTITAPTTIMYAVSISLESIGIGGTGHLIDATLSWTSPSGGSNGTAHAIDLTLPLDSAQLVMETYPILTLANTSITMACTYAGGATDDEYTVSIRLVQMPGGTI